MRSAPIGLAVKLRKFLHDYAGFAGNKTGRAQDQG